MATLLIRDLNDSVKEKIRVRAAQHGRSMVAEARTILEDGTSGGSDEVREHPYHIIRRAVAKYGPLDIELPSREFSREPPTFE